MNPNPQNVYDENGNYIGTIKRPQELSPDSGTGSVLTCLMAYLVFNLLVAIAGLIGGSIYLLFFTSKPLWGFVFIAVAILLIYLVRKLMK